MNIRDGVFRVRINDLTYERNYHLAEAYVYDLQIKTLYWRWVAAQSLIMVDEGCPNHCAQGDQ